MVRVTVPIPGRSYDVVVGAGVLARTGALLPELPKAARAFVVADRAVVDHGFGALAGSLKEAGLDPVLLSVPSGEEAKSLQVYGTLVHQLATQEGTATTSSWRSAVAPRAISRGSSPRPTCGAYRSCRCPRR